MSVNPFPLQLSLIKGKNVSSIDDDDMKLKKRGGVAGAAAAAGAAGAAGAGAIGGVAGALRGAAGKVGKEVLESLEEYAEGEGDPAPVIPPVDMSTGTRNGDGVNDKNDPVKPDEKTLEHPLGMSDNIKNSFFAHSRYPKNPDFKKFLPALAAAAPVLSAAGSAAASAIGAAMKPADVPSVNLGSGQSPTAKSGDMKPKKPSVKTSSGTVIY